MRVATLPFGSVIADAPKSKNAKVTLVYQHELPNVPGKLQERVNSLLDKWAVQHAERLKAAKRRRALSK